MPFLIDFRTGYPDSILSRLSLLSANASAINAFSARESHDKFARIIYTDIGNTRSVGTILPLNQRQKIFKRTFIAQFLCFGVNNFGRPASSRSFRSSDTVNGHVARRKAESSRQCDKQ